nr:glycine-rich cell wall structural protein 1-like [Malus domestica]
MGVRRRMWRMGESGFGFGLQGGTMDGENDEGDEVSADSRGGGGWGWARVGGGDEEEVEDGCTVGLKWGDGKMGVRMRMWRMGGSGFGFGLQGGTMDGEDDEGDGVSAGGRGVEGGVMGSRFSNSFFLGCKLGSGDGKIGARRRWRMGAEEDVEDGWEWFWIWIVGRDDGWGR